MHYPCKYENQFIKLAYFAKIDYYKDTFTNDKFMYGAFKHFIPQVVFKVS